MAACIQCGSYTKFNGGLCYSCYKADNANEVEVLEENQEEVTTGLSESDRNYRYNMIKGRIAETLIQELFLSLDYNVFRYGMENTIPGIMDLLKGVRTDVADDIRRMPDFVIQNPNDKKVYFIEVKFRANGSFKLKDLPASYPYQNAFIILVSKKHIKCITVDELYEGKEITPKSQNYLGNRNEFDLDKETIIEFCKFAVQFFEGV
ncbi:hypothetical protein OQ279_06905 [Salinimicrobium sp. MT39]|uniref:Uncharacterized protein n=1 Tax=Salinimicrobium profundisediminis TaxID=2994553 RepID=A0A9X3CWF7_9FLAO|nr:hypothetical protein [Salinimicrobium profundisediminis]MCX2837880.1 hypothetical protein [Salinimicrobium profundisediminis]